MTIKMIASLRETTFSKDKIAGLMSRGAIPPL